MFTCFILPSFSYLIFTTKIDNIVDNTSRLILNEFAGVIDLYNNALGKIRNLNNVVFSTTTLQQEIVDLQVELDKYKALGVQLTIVQDENKQLRNLLNFFNSLELPHVSGRIISLNNDLYSNKAIVKLSKPHDVKAGDVVLNYQGLIGKIIEVNNDYAKILLITDFTSRLAVKSSQNSTKAILVGKNAKALELLYLLDHQEIEEGEILISADDSTINISDLPVAKMVRDKNGNLYPETLVDFSKLDFVSIIKAKL